MQVLTQRAVGVRMMARFMRRQCGRAPSLKQTKSRNEAYSIEQIAGMSFQSSADVLPPASPGFKVFLAVSEIVDVRCKGTPFSPYNERVVGSPGCETAHVCCQDLRVRIQSAKELP